MTAGTSDAAKHSRNKVNNKSYASDRKKKAGEKKNRQMREHATPTTHKIKIQVVDEETVKVSIYGEIYKCASFNVGTASQESFDIQRCFFGNPKDNNYLVLQLGAHGHCDACLMRVGTTPKVIYRVPVSPNKQNNNKNELDHTENVDYNSWLETDINEQGVPKGKLIWRGNALVPSVYFPANTKHCSVQTNKKCQKEFNTSIPSLDQFTPIEEIVSDFNLLKNTDTYSQVWLDHLPQPASH